MFVHRYINMQIGMFESILICLAIAAILQDECVFGGSVTKFNTPPILQRNKTVQILQKSAEPIKVGDDSLLLYSVQPNFTSSQHNVSTGLEPSKTSKKSVTNGDQEYFTSAQTSIYNTSQNNTASETDQSLKSLMRKRSIFSALATGLGHLASSVGLGKVVNTVVGVGKSVVNAAIKAGKAVVRGVKKFFAGSEPTTSVTHPTPRPHTTTTKSHMVTSTKDPGTKIPDTIVKNQPPSTTPAPLNNHTTTNVERPLRPKMYLPEYLFPPRPINRRTPVIRYEPPNYPYYYDLYDIPVYPPRYYRPQNPPQYVPQNPPQYRPQHPYQFAIHHPYTQTVTTNGNKTPMNDRYIKNRRYVFGNDYYE